MEKNGFSVLVERFLEARHQINSRPLPVFLGGKEVDLFKLSIQVRASGGYDATHGRWSLVAEKLGFGPECGPSLKLVYAKYLKALESWMPLMGNEEKSASESHFLSEIKLWMKVAAESKQFKGFKHNASLKRVLKKGNSRSIKATKKAPELPCDGDFSRNTSKRRCLGSRSLNITAGELTEVAIEATPVPLSKEAEPLLDILEWIKRIALNPGDLKRGRGPRGSKQNKNWIEKCSSRTNRIRALLWGQK